MVCVNPLTAFRGEDGSVVFKTEHPRPKIQLPCGQCIGCRIDKSRAWALRCVHEAQEHARNCFVTLTYNQDCLPKDGSLCVRDWQLFAKRLRKNVGPFRFYMCGEYGSENYRPHYHALLFGIDFIGDRVLLRREVGSASLFRSSVLDGLWQKGYCSVGDLTYQSALYVAKYCMKKATGPLALEKYRRIDIETGEEYYVKAEFTVMSRGGRGGRGIGHGWFQRYRRDVFPSDEVVYNGKKYRPPRYYDAIYDVEDPDAMEGIRAKRARMVRLNREESSPERLRVREEIMKADAAFAERGL